MVQTRGNAVAYVGGTTHIDLPMATDGYRAAHQPREPKRGGFDWDWNKAACAGCSTKVAKSQLVDGRCPACRGVTEATPGPANVHTAGDDAYVVLDDDQVADRFTAPARPAPAATELPAHDGTRLGRSLVELERDAPTVAASAARLDDAVRRITRPDDHVRPEHLEVDDTAQPHHATTDASIDAVVALVSTRQLLLGLSEQVQAALAHLDVLERHLHQTPAAPADPRASAPRATPPSPRSPRLGRHGPAADREGEARRRPAQRERGGPEPIELPIADIVAAYRAGQTLAQIAATHGVTAPTIRRRLIDAGVERRHAPVEHTPELVEQVRRLYVDEGLTKAEVAERIGRSAKVIENVMTAHGIPARPAVARQGADRSRSLKERMAELGVASRDIKAWALDQGLVDHIAVGLPSRRLVDAYAAAHHPTTGRTGQTGSTP